MSSQNQGRLSQLTEQLRSEGVKPLVPFLTAGYPDEHSFLRVLKEACQAGCPLVEIGIPFSDPVADGPVIQASSQQVLAQGMNLRRTLELAAEAREMGLAVILMGYLNPILKMGVAEFADGCAEAKVAGVIIPDLPSEESPKIRALLLNKGTDLVELVAPTTDPQRLSNTTKVATGFLYLVSTTGVTGAGTSTAQGPPLSEYVSRVRKESALPLYVGFGISNPDQAAQVAAIADGVIVGSALIKLIGEANSPNEAVVNAGNFLSQMAAAMKPQKGSLS
ncbi:MAG: tryptophan synthase alpha chain [Candidatus Krumholzibacteriia bacterium]|jgi:tryptophan synthase alpha chain